MVYSSRVHAIDASLYVSDGSGGRCVVGGGGSVHGKVKSATVRQRARESMGGGIGLSTNLTHGTSVILR